MTIANRCCQEMVVMSTAVNVSYVICCFYRRLHKKRLSALKLGAGSYKPPSRLIPRFAWLVADGHGALAEGLFLSLPLVYLACGGLI